MDDEAKADRDDEDSTYDSGEVGSLHDFIDDSGDVDVVEDEDEDEEVSEYEKKARAKVKSRAENVYVLCLPYCLPSSDCLFRETPKAKGRAQRFDIYSLYLGVY